MVETASTPPQECTADWATERERPGVGFALPKVMSGVRVALKLGGARQEPGRTGAGTAGKDRPLSPPIKSEKKT